MDRREMLARTGALLGTVSLGGCLGRYRDIAGGVRETTTQEETPTQRETITGETTTAEQQTATRGQRPTLTDESFEVLNSGCGEPASEASVRFREANGSVVVTGTIPGSNSCYIARLADASYDPETDSLDVTVVSLQKEGAEVCAQCIVEIAYEATFAFEGGLPETVTVVHEAMGETTTVVSANQ